MAAKKVASKKELGAGAKVGIGLGLTAAAVAAAGAYFLVGSKKATENRRKMKGWTLKAKGEVLEALESAKEITAEEYGQLVETATAAYGTVKQASKGEIRDFKNEMLEHWKKLERNKVVKKLVDGKPVGQKKTARKAVPKKAITKEAKGKK
jgi:hypothetical protein